jgi:hypothetical protein
LKKKISKKSAACWEYFSIKEKANEHGTPEKFAVCQKTLSDGNICAKEYSYNSATTTLNRHLVTKHALQIKTLDNYRSRRSKIENDFNILVLNMILSGALPYRIVENKFFKLIINNYTSQKLPNRTLLSDIQDEYYIKTKKHVIDFLSKLSEFSITTDSWTAKYMKKSFISLTVHYLNSDWKSGSTSLGIFNVEGSHSHTAIAEKIVELFNEFKINGKVGILVADNASNMKLVAKKLNLQFLGCFGHLINLIVKKALAITSSSKPTQNDDDIIFSEEEDGVENEADVAAEDGTGGLEAEADMNFNIDDQFFTNQNETAQAEIKPESLKMLNNILNSIRKVVGLFNSSTLLLDELRKLQKDEPLVPIQDVITRWNSLFMMLERFIQIFTQIKTTLNINTNPRYEKHRTFINSLNTRVIKMLSIVVEILRPFYNITRILSGDTYPSVSIILHACFYLKKKLSKILSCKLSSEFQKIMNNSFDDYMKKYKVFENKFLCAATFLDPVYRNFSHCSSDEKAQMLKYAKEFILEYLKDSRPKPNPKGDNVEDDSSSDESVNSFYGESTPEKISTEGQLSEELDHEIISYMNTLSEEKEKCNEFWLKNHSKFKHLGRVAKYVLSATATSCPSERLFSEGTNQIWARRNRLAASTIEKIMFLLCNIENELNSIEFEE